MKKAQYKLIKNAMLGIKEAHETQDYILLNYYASILEGFEHLQAFDCVLNQIKREIKTEE